MHPLQLPTRLNAQFQLFAIGMAAAPASGAPLHGTAPNIMIRGKTVQN